ncbi:hypothetical protein ACWCWD_26510 [Streptomyces sp. NPDC001493]
MSYHGWFVLVMSAMLIWIPAALYLAVKCSDGGTKGAVVLRTGAALVVLGALALGLWGLASLVPPSRCDHSTAQECELHTP